MQVTNRFFLQHQTQSDLPGDQYWLHPDELRFLETLHFEKRRNDWLLGRWTAKQALREFLAAQNLEVDPSAIAIHKADSGAPVVQGEGLPACSLSISHRAGHALAVVAPGEAAIGCDLELIEWRSEAFISDYFSEKERAWIVSNPPLYANLFWSVKEAVMKATGEGMSLHPGKIEVDLPWPDPRKEWNRVFAEVAGRGRLEGRWKMEDNLIWVVMEYKGAG
jgi:4'-phosphopantetheinyl transferase